MTHAELSRETQLQAWSLLRRYGYTLEEVKACIGQFNVNRNEDKAARVLWWERNIERQRGKQSDQRTTGKKDW